jgi:hypothetical protein
MATSHSIEGSNIGNAAGSRTAVRSAIASSSRTFSPTGACRSARCCARRWILALGDPVEEQDGNVRAVLATGTQLEHFQKVFRTDGLP